MAEPMHPHHQQQQQTSPFLRLLPLEIRLMIYEYLLLPSDKPSSTHASSVANLMPDYHTYYSSDTNNDPFTLTVRTIDPFLGGGGGAGGGARWRRRSTYRVRTGEWDPSAFDRPFQTSTIPTTYRVLLSPYTSHLRHTIPSLLPVCRQIHAEASKVLYSSYTFAFHANIEALVPFFSDLTPWARAHVARVQITKKALPYTKEFDRAEWKGMCAFLAGMEVRELELGVVAGRPVGEDDGWEGVRGIRREEFEVLGRVQREWTGGRFFGEEGAGSAGGIDLQWVVQLMRVGGLRRVDVRALVESCQRPRSEVMAFWVAFSKSVEGGFSEWVRSVMVGAE